MPTPVATAKQCLTEEAGKALDDAVAVAIRRNNLHTTSLHAVSALLSPSYNLLRDSLTRIRSSAYSPRLQFRALELCVGVSLDRLPSSKTTHQNANHHDEFAPPVSNSLMAAIKRSQANQRRQPNMYFMSQVNVGCSSSGSGGGNGSTGSISISCVKVEMKHFILSILDDPIVSRVFAEAGFRSGDIKLMIVNPPLPMPMRWATSMSTRCPPLFLCSFSGSGGGGSGGDENCRRISEVMVKKNERNPLLVGVCAKDALFSFKDCLEKKIFDGVSKEIHGVKLVCLENDIFDLVRVRIEEDVFDLKVKEVKSSLEVSSSSPGVVICLGELKVLVEDDDDNDYENHGDLVRHLVVRVSELVKLYRKKLWLIGSASNYETYSKFVSKFPSIEKDWDLHPLPITSSRSSFDALGSKSSFMGSFVPFGGFFSTPSDFKPQLTAMNRPFKRCNSCNKMYEREFCSVLKEGSSLSVSDKYLVSLPSWLQTADSDLSKGADIVAQVKDMKATSNEKIAVLQKKWDDHCQHLHQSLSFSALGVSLPRPLTHQNPAFHFVSDKRGGSSSSSGDTSLTEGVCSSSSSMAQNIPSQAKVMAIDFPRSISDLFECHSSMKESPNLGYSIRNLAFPRDHKLYSSVSVTTDLSLGMVYGPKHSELDEPFLQDHQFHLQHSQQSKQTIHSSFLGDYKLILQKLSEAVAWQREAVSKISQIVSCRRSGNVRGGVWLSFLGPDKVGKRRVAEALADSVFGSRNHLVAVDFSSRHRSNKVDSLFICQGSYNFDSRIIVADHIAQELTKKPNSVLFLENIDEADPLVRNSLSRAIQTGKFQDSRRRELSIKNVIFVASTTTTKDDYKTSSPRKEFIKFMEETILEAKSWQMKIDVRTVSGDAASISDETRVSLLSPKRTINQETLSKRKALDHLEESNKPIKTPKNSLDLNLPLYESEETTEQDISDREFLSNGSRAWLDNFFAQTDGNVVFRPFDFDAEADKLLRKIRLKFEELLKGGKMSLEIDYQVMVQILAAAWCSNNKGAVENWIDQVLGACFVEIRERYNLNHESVVSLVTYLGVPLKNESASDWICLPQSINLSV